MADRGTRCDGPVRALRFIEVHGVGAGTRDGIAAWGTRHGLVTDTLPRPRIPADPHDAPARAPAG